MKSVDEKIADVLAESAELASGVLHGASVSKQTGSPIEKLMLAALWSRGVWQDKLEFASWAAGCYTDEILVSEAKVAIAVGDHDYKARLCQQMIVGDYKADFGLVVAVSNHEHLTVVVECDGHDFHEKTKEQVAYDKARDRFFTSKGIRVFRFSGSEIWRDAGACADEVLRFMAEWVWENTVGDRRRRMAERKDAPSVTAEGFIA